MVFDLPNNVTLGPDHIWSQVFDSAKRFKSPTPALFLDRDGVIVEEVHYLHKIEDVALIDGAADVIAKANAHNIPVIIVTNQAGIARDMFTWAEFNIVQNRMLELLHNKTGAFVDAVYACPYHKTGIEPYRAASHEARKPNPGMLLRSFDALPIQAERSWIIGDKAADLEAGRNAGLKGAIHVLTGHGKDDGEVESARALARDGFTIALKKSIHDALNIDLFS
jgi:D-glycero-D-manno-heptose 1,7-bisphosphate phosphatase